MIKVATIIIALLMPTLAHANFAWPPLFYAHTYAIWWVVLAGFVIELLVYFYTIETQFKKVFKLTFLINLASAIAGIIFSYASIIFLVAEPLIIVGMFASPIFIYAITVIIEYLAATKILHYQKGNSVLIPIAVANIPSVGLAIWQTIVLTGDALSG
jgi:hypothetical protein